MAAGGIQNSYSASAGNSIGTAFSAVELNGASALGGKHIGSQCFFGQDSLHLEEHLDSGQLHLVPRL